MADAAAPRVSICIPTYNGAAFLRETLACALEQTMRDVEILLLDDGSRDDTLELARRLTAHDRRVRVLANERNCGLVGNWNRCLVHARGDWVKFLFQDDTLLPHALERMLERAERDGARFVACYRDFIFEPGTDPGVAAYYVEQRDLVSGWLSGRTFAPADFADLAAASAPRNLVGEPTVTLLHRTAIAETGLFDENFIQLCDAEYWVRAALRCGLSVVPERLAGFRVHGGSTTRANNTSKSYRMLSLDPLLLMYKYLFQPEFSLLRARAAETGRLEELEFEFWAASHHARAYALEQDSRGNAAPLAEWRALVQRYPLLERIPRNQILRRKLRALRVKVAP